MLGSDYRRHSRAPLVLGLGVYVSLSHRRQDETAKQTPFGLRVVDLLARAAGSHFALLLRAAGDHL
jgi:hypothetical protein